MYLRFCELSYDVIGGFNKAVQHSIKNISRNIKRCSSNLASVRYITKEAKWHLSCHCHDNSYAAGPVLIKTKIPRFYRKRGSSTHNNLMGRVKAIWEPFVYRAKPSVPHKKVASQDIWFCTEERLEPRVLPWQQHSSCHSVSFVMYVWRALLQFFWRYSWLSVALFQWNHLWRHHFPHLHNTKTYVSLKRKKDIPKRKTPLFFTLKSLSNAQLLFFTS